MSFVGRKFSAPPPTAYPARLLAPAGRSAELVILGPGRERPDDLEDVSASARQKGCASAQLDPREGCRTARPATGFSQPRGTLGNKTTTTTSDNNDKRQTTGPSLGPTREDPREDIEEKGSEEKERVPPSHEPTSEEPVQQSRWFAKGRNLSGQDLLSLFEGVEGASYELARPCIEQPPGPAPQQAALLVDDGMDGSHRATIGPHRT